MQNDRTEMKITLSFHGKQFEADLADALSIAIPLVSDTDLQPNAFGAPPFEASPHIDGDFTGSLAAGAPINFFNLRLNPHGNGTHTECAGHIVKGDFGIDACLTQSHWIAEVISVYPTVQQDGDRVITAATLRALQPVSGAGALIVRTEPNTDDKCSRKYTGSNPPYFTPEAMQWIHEQGYYHLLTDLPSVDRESDGGALTAHRIFWQTEKSIRRDRTITEMAYVNKSIPDGLYLLDIQIAALHLDASPSRPVLYKLLSRK